MKIGYTRHTIIPFDRNLSIVPQQHRAWEAWTRSRSEQQGALQN